MQSHKVPIIPSKTIDFSGNAVKFHNEILIILHSFWMAASKKPTENNRNNNNNNKNENGEHTDLI